jgi:hypothetical protein
MTFDDVIATLNGHGRSQVCTLTPSECLEMAVALASVITDEREACARLIESTKWLTPDISIAVLPQNGACLPRSAENLRATVALFCVESAERYRRRDITGDGAPETFCNIFVSDTTRALGAEIPHNVAGAWQDVRANAEWLRAKNDGWRIATAAEAQARANVGYPSIVVWDAPNRAHGHIALLVPQRTNETGVVIAQAGASNFSHGPLIRGFGQAAPLEFFTHD